MNGQRLLHYEILEKLGEGGMGVVHKALDTHLDRFGAIKVLPAGKMTDPERKRRFIQEAKAASALNHPGIITIHDISEAEGIDFLVMEYVPGKALDQVIPRRGLRLNEALKYAVEIADALAAAHGAGIVHRDLKPANVMVSEQGRVKVLDFGLAKLTEPAPTGQDAPTQTLKPATEEGVVVGTAAYMAPEQAQGRHIDARSDIFSFGSVLYEMVTGRRAFASDSKMSTLAAVLNKEPAPLPAETPHDLEKIIARCLRKDPARRFQHMADVKVALEELKEESDSGKLAAPVQPSRRRARWPWAAGMAALLLVAAFAYWLVLTRSPRTDGPLKAVPLTALPGQEWSPTFSPNGNQVAFTWNGEKQDNFDIYVQMIGTGARLRVTHDPAVDYSPAWSPDERQIAFLRQLPGGRSGIFLVPPIGGPERKLTEITASFDDLVPIRAPRLAWSPGGRWLAAPDRLSLVLVSTETGETSAPVATPANRRDWDPTFSPDGRALAFLRGSVFDGDLYTLALTEDGNRAGEPTRRAEGLLRPAAPLWTTRGDALLFSAGELAGARLWRTQAYASGVPQAVPLPAMDVNQAAVSIQGARLAYAHWYLDTDIWCVELDRSGGKAQRVSRLISSTRPDYMARFSPDGRRIAFLSFRSGSVEIWVSAGDGSNAVQLTSIGGSLVSAPQWSPDGESLTFDSRAERQAEIYVINSRGGKPRRLTFDPADDTGPVWSRDGKWIYYSSNRGGSSQLWKIPGGGGEPVQVTRGDGSNASESVDGMFLYFARSTSGIPGLWRWNLASGEETRIVAALHRPGTFAVVENGVYFVPPPESGAAHQLQFLEFASGAIHTIATSDKPVAQTIAASPDGRVVLYDLRENMDSDLMLVENFR